ncbi:MAG: hypothetical protein ACI9LM_003087 [Alteromonadaceae bacterium]|jgi:hypothetical protein
MRNGLILSIVFVFLSLTSTHSNSYAYIENNQALENLPEVLSQLQLTLVGSAVFSVLFWDIYKSTLYTKTGNYNKQQAPEILLFEIEYLKDITAAELIKRTIEQWYHLEKAESQYLPYIAKLTSIWPDIKSGDKLTLLKQNGRSVFYFNHVKIGIIEQDEFSALFLDIWLSPKTSQKALRTELLGDSK